MKKFFCRLLILTPCFFLSACSGFFYFPIKEEMIDRAKLPRQPQDVYFRSEDGNPLHAWYFKADGRAKAVILFFHGNGQNLSTHFLSLYNAPQKGYDYLIFDYRGYGQSPGFPSPDGTVKDGRAALRFIKSQHPNLPIIIFGQSLGGIVALRTALDMKTEIPVKAIVVDSTFASYRSVARSVMAKSWLLWLFQPLGWAIVDNSQGVKHDLSQLAPIPLLVIHGEKDPMIDLSQGQAVFQSASEPKEFWSIPEGGHTDFMWRENGKYAQKFFNYLDSKL